MYIGFPIYLIYWPVAICTMKYKKNVKANEKRNNLIKDMLEMPLTWVFKISERFCDISKPLAPTLRLLILLNGFSQNSSY